MYKASWKSHGNPLREGEGDLIRKAGVDLCCKARKFLCNSVVWSISTFRAILKLSNAFTCMMHASSGSPAIYYLLLSAQYAWLCALASRSQAQIALSSLMDSPPSSFWSQVAHPPKIWWASCLLRNIARTCVIEEGCSQSALETNNSSGGRRGWGNVTCAA